MRKNRFHAPFLLAACSMALTAPALPLMAQTVREENAQIFKQAQQSAQQERALRNQESASHARAEQLLAQARNNQGGASVSASQQAVLDAAASRLDAAVANVSDQGKVLLAQNTQAPAMKAPGAEKVVPANEVTIADVAGAKPAPMRATPVEKPKNDDAVKTVITSTGAAYFDSKQAMGVFTDDVVVKHPQFHITCDVLEVYMRKEGEAAKPAPAPRRDPQTPLPLPGETPKDNSLADSGVERAIAKGRKVVIQKLSETGEMQIGICRHATYDGATGDIVMRDYPQVQRGTNVVIATDSSTVMTIKPNGELKTNGPTRVDLIRGEGAKGNNNQTPASASANPQ